MPIIRSTGAKPMLTRAGGPLVNSPGNVAAPPIVTPPSALAFDMATGSKRGWYGSNNQFENFFLTRDWAANFADQSESFAGIRWQPTWTQAFGFYGTWEVAGGDVFRVQRKGTTGPDAQTLVFTCGPNPAAVPVGEPVVFWQSFSQGDYSTNSTLNLSGYNLPLRQKLTVSRSVGSAFGDPNGRRIIEVNVGQALPAIDFSPATNAGVTQKQLQHRHWRFYKDTATKALRYPLSNMTDLSINSVLANGGYLMLGGMQSQPTYVDWTHEWTKLGASLVEELWKLECEGLANYFGSTDPRRCAVEPENEPTIQWNGETGYPTGYGQLLKDVWYPVMRTAWGPERTIVLKGSFYGGLNAMLNDFDFVVPSGHNCHLVIHNYDGQINGPSGAIGFTDIGQTNWIADQIKAKITALGFKGGGATEMGVWSGNVPNDADRGQRMGRLLTSFTSRDLYNFAWSLVGDAYRCSDIQTLNGKSIEAFQRGLAPYCRRSGIMTT
jgi:hypothetical protein